MRKITATFYDRHKVEKVMFKLDDYGLDSKNLAIISKYDDGYGEFSGGDFFFESTNGRGGIVAMLRDFGFSKENAIGYDTDVRNGAILLVFSATESCVKEATKIFRECGAGSVRTSLKYKNEGLMEHWHARQMGV